MRTKYERWAEANLDVKEYTGNELVMLCMFHDDHSPSLYFNRTTGLWLCHACGERGNFQNLRQRLFGDGGLVERVTTDSIQDLLESISALDGDDEDSTPEILDESYLTQFQPSDYWSVDRGLTSKTIERFGLGWDAFMNDHTIPIRNHTGNLLGVIRRKGGKLKEGFPRYQYPKGVKTSQVMFGSWEVTKRSIYVTEGAIDAMCIWDLGRQAVALGGARLSDAQANIIRMLGVTRVVVWPDNPNIDGAAEEMVRTVHKKLRDVDVRSVHWGNQHLAKDVNDLRREHRRAMLEAHISGSDWLEDVARI